MVERDILHIDMNAFYCSCHAAADPARYRGKPTAVAGSPETRHGVVVTASYEARRLGVRATMTVPEALRACPSLILIQPDFSLYRRYSRKVMDIVREYTPLVEVFSIDECFADVSGSHRLGNAREMAKNIQDRLYQELQLPCSVGIGSNKFLAKMASDRKKPLGITEIRRADIRTELWPLPLSEMFGVGRRTADRLATLGITRIGDLAAANPLRMERLLGKRGVELWQLANGKDDRPVSPTRPPNKSVGHSITMPRDVVQFDEIQTVLLNLADQVGRRLRRHGARARSVQVTIRYSNRQTITRAKTLVHASDVTEDLYTAAVELARVHWERGRPVRLLGISAQQLSYDLNPTSPTVQLSLFSDADGAVMADDGKARERWQRLDRVTDRLRDKYGENIILRGRMLTAHASAELRDHDKRGTSLQKDILENAEWNGEEGGFGEDGF
ncbi:DNA polymerase IV [Alicyclobacillus herbarius]|uniref:DNA polymerase IV n=1 Tax=Alicyclobacillus herbarius TaxID=122960 RepID=UPI002351FDC4|nr:DNA polymerase IV [Alicyclobacillus herbarius]